MQNHTIFVICTSIKIAAYHRPSTISHKNSNSKIFSQTQLTLQHNVWLFSLQLLTYCSTIGASFSHILLMVTEQFTLFTAQCCLNNWFKGLSTRATSLQSLVSQLIGTNEQSVRCSYGYFFITITKGIKAKVEISLKLRQTIHFIHNSTHFSNKLSKFR